MKAALAGIICFLATSAEAGCGQNPQPCNMPDGSYHVLSPDTPTGQAVVFLHGHGGSGAGSLGNAGMVNVLLARGYTVIAPDGQALPAGKGRSWAFRVTDAIARNDALFIQAVADDAAQRFALNRNAMLLAGFSVGGSMVSYLACDYPTAFAAFAPVAGSFWQPEPKACAGTVSLLHSHGWADLTVPLEGRTLRKGLAQGDVFQALQTWRLTNDCTQSRPNDFSTKGDFRIRSWTDCAPGTRLDFALHFGGHIIPKGWAKLALDWFEALPPKP